MLSCFPYNYSTMHVFRIIAFYKYVASWLLVEVSIDIKILKAVKIDPANKKWENMTEITC